MPLPFSVWGVSKGFFFRGVRGVGAHMVSQLSIFTSVRPIPYVHMKNGSSSISFEKISVLDFYFIHRYIIIKCR